MNFDNDPRSLPFWASSQLDPEISQQLIHGEDSLDAARVKRQQTAHRGDISRLLDESLEPTGDDD